MAESGAFRDEVRVLLRHRLLDAAREITTAHGWSTLTMDAVASRVGISRTHLYKEVGTKQDLGDAMVERETDNFLDLIREQLRGHPTDLVAGFGAAARHSIEHGARNDLVKAILAADDPRADSLLPLLTAQPEAVLRRVTSALSDEVSALHPHLGRDADEVPTMVDGISRIVLSHLTQPSGPTVRAVRQVEWLARAVTQEPSA